MDDTPDAKRRDAPTRLPPHAIECEQGVLGCLLIGGPETFAECSERLTESGEEFYDLRHRAIYQTMVGLYGRRRPIDPVTVVQALKDSGQLESVGGTAYLAALPDAVPSAANLRHYADTLLDKYGRRQMLNVCVGGINEAYDEGKAVETVIDQFEEAALGIRKGAPIEEVNVKDALGRCVDRLEKAAANPGMLWGLPTGFADFDRMTHGLAPGDMVVIAARPSCGKTSLGMNVVEHLSIDKGVPVAVFSLEMDGDKLLFRMLCSRARVNADSAIEGRMTEPEMKRMVVTNSQIRRAPIHIIDRGGLSIGQIRGFARKMVQRHKIQLIVIDYLQLVSAPVGKGDNRTTEVTKISAGIKAMAKELGVPVIVLAQLNREMEKGGRAPRLSDLRESGAIEQDGDVIVLMHRKGDANEEIQTIVADIAKQRNGRTGPVELTFFKSFTRFESCARVRETGTWRPE